MAGPGSGAAGRARGWRWARASGAAGPATGRAPGRASGAAGRATGTGGPGSAAAAPGTGTAGPGGGRARARGTAGRASGAAGPASGTGTAGSGVGLQSTTGGGRHKKCPRQLGGTRVHPGWMGGAWRAAAGGMRLGWMPPKGCPGALQSPGDEGRQRALRFSQPPAPLTAVEALLLQQRAEDLALQGAEVPQAAQLLRQLRVGQRQVHPAAGTARSPRAEHPGPQASSTLPAPGTVGAPKMTPNRAP